MNLVVILSFLMLLSCDPYNFGFKANPAKILSDAVESTKSGDKQKFLKVVGKEVLCLYGNDQGLAYLKQHTTVSKDDIQLGLTKLTSTYYDLPEYVGYWSYLNERYVMDVADERTGEKILQAIVDCDYGFEGERSVKYKNLNPKRYKRKECKLTKLIPKTFAPIKMTPRCQILKVKVDGLEE